MTTDSGFIRAMEDALSSFFVWGVEGQWRVTMSD